jgi:hypothetical protein
MSLYSLQKLMYHLNRDPKVRTRLRDEPAVLLAQYDLAADERAAIDQSDVGLLYVLGVNGQLLMHYAAFIGLEWPEYLQAMRNGVVKHGPVRAGIYAMTTEAPAPAVVTNHEDAFALPPEAAR